MKTKEKNRLEGADNNAEEKIQQQIISIPRPDIRVINVRVVGDSPLITHAWSEKAKKLMLDKQMKKAKQGKDAKDPWMDFCDSLYWLTPKPAKPTEGDVDRATFGIPAICFKHAAVYACSHVDGITKVVARGAFHIEGDILPIDGKPQIREDMVRIAMGTADIRYRGEFKGWSVDLSIRYNASVISPEQIVNLLTVAGFASGVGEWRPSRNGNFGMFKVEGR